MHKLILSASILMVLFACKKEEEPIDFGFDYYDMTPGRYIVYDVLSINHTGGSGGIDTTRYQLKTVIGDTITDNAGRIAREFYRYRRNTSGENWQITDLWTTIITDFRAELVEENQRKIKLIFKPVRNKSWNPNEFNSSASEDWYYDWVGKEWSVGTNNFNDALFIEQEDEFNLIQRKRKYQVYARGIGLIETYSKDLNINNFDTTNVSSGKELYWKAIDWGIE